jgi:predicted nucleotidyltransferase
MSKVEQSSAPRLVSFAIHIENLKTVGSKELVMNLPQQAFVNVSGIDPNEAATMVFVWCRDKGLEDYVLLGSGHVVNVPANARPPGIQAGQYSITFPLRPGCSIEDVFVTEDKSGSERLTGVTVSDLSQSGLRLAEVASVADDPTDSRTGSGVRTATMLNGRT